MSIGQSAKRVETTARSDRVREQLTSLREENAGLRRENRRLRAALDTYVSRARSVATHGPLEMTAGTSIGPRRRPLA